MRQISYDLLPLGSIKISAWYLALWVGLPGRRRADSAHRVRTAVVCLVTVFTGLGVGTRKIRRCSLSKTNSWPRWLLRWMPFLPAPVPRRPLNPKVAAHGDFACTAAMQLAKPLKLNPAPWANSSRPRWRPPRLPALGGCGLKSQAPAS